MNRPPNFAAPSQLAVVVVRRHPDSGERHLDLLRWGFLPYWTKDPKQARKLINAKAETVASSGMFRARLRPAPAWCRPGRYKRRKLDGGRKQPFAIARSDGAPAPGKDGVRRRARSSDRSRLSPRAPTR